MNRIGDYALIGDCHSAALVGRDGSIDWACFPRFRWQCEGDGITVGGNWTRAMQTQKAIAEFIADRRLASFGPDDRVSAAVAAMKEHQSDCVLVCESEKLRGIFTQRDFLNRVAVVGRSDGMLRDVMTKEPNALQEQDSIMSALHRMAVGNYRNIPIVDGSGRAVANLSIWDVMKHLSEVFSGGGDQEEEAVELAAVGRRSLEAVRPRPAVTVAAADPLLGILNLMVQRACGAVLVEDRADVAGIFAERDLMFRVDYSTTAWHDTPVSEVMVPNPVCMTRNTTIADALDTMNTHKFRHLPIVDQDQKEEATLVSIRDIISFVATRQERAPARG